MAIVASKLQLYFGNYRNLPQTSEILSPKYSNKILRRQEADSQSAKDNLIFVVQCVLIFWRIRIFNKLPLHDNVRNIIKHQSIRRLAIASSAAGFLIIAFNIFGIFICTTKRTSGLLMPMPKAMVATIMTFSLVKKRFDFAGDLWSSCQRDKHKI